MKRTSRSRRKKKALRQSLTSPLTPVLLGLVIVLGVGFWAMRDTPPKEPEAPPAQTTSTGGGESTPVVANQPGSKPGEKPADPPSVPATSAETSGAEPAPPPAASGPAQPPAESAPASRSQIDRSGGAADTMLVTVYYADGLTGGMSLQPVEMKIPRSTTPIKDTVEQLLNPPASLDLYSEFPAGTHPLGFNLANGVATVDLSPEMAQVQGTAAANTIMASLVYSLTEIPGVEAVQLWVNGSPAVLHGVEWAEPLTRADMDARNLFHVESVIPYSGS